MSPAPAQLIVYAFGPDAQFQGQLAGALERLESGGAMRVLEVLFVAHDAERDEVVAYAGRGEGGGGIAAGLLDFRLDPAARQRMTRRSLDGVAGDALRELAGELRPGGALAAIFVSHVWADVLADAARRIGGELVADSFVDAAVLEAELAR
jgi:hypothetical protein